MIWPWLISGAALAGWFSTRYAWWRRTVDWRQPRVLMYHMIAPPRPDGYNGLRVSPPMFERQLIWLRENNFAFATMSDLAAGKITGRTVALTFDDGYEDNFVNALPLLEKYGARATVYLIATRLANEREPKLTPDQVRQLADSGVFELGAHTLSHANLRKLSPEQKYREIHDCKVELEQTFGIPISSFAYPFGIWDQTDRKLVAESGYTTAVTTDVGIDPLPFPDPFAIKRVKVSGKEGFFSFLLRMRTGQRAAWK